MEKDQLYHQINL